MSFQHQTGSLSDRPPQGLSHSVGQCTFVWLTIYYLSGSRLLSLGNLQSSVHRDTNDFSVVER